MATPKVIERFIKETRRLDIVNVSNNVTADHNQVFIANASLLINLPEPVDGTEIFLKTRTDQSVHLIAPPQSTIDGAGQRVSNGSFQSVRLIAGEGTWYKVSELGSQFSNLDRPSYTLSNFSAPTQADYNETISGSIDILNEGDLGNELMSLTIDGTTIDSENVELGFNDSTTLTLSGAVSVLPGNYQLTISSPAASISQNFEVTTPPTFISIESFTAPIEADNGDSVQVDTTVANDGQDATDVPVQLYIDRGEPSEQLVEEKIVDLNFLEERELSFFFDLQVFSESVTLEIVTPDASQSQELQVNL